MISKKLIENLLKYHPDKTKGDKTSEEKFKELVRLITSFQMREKLISDQFGHAAFKGEAVD